MTKTTLIVVTGVMLSGCVTTNAVMLDHRARFAPVAPEDVVVFLSEADVPYEYEAIALVHAKGDHEWTDEGDMIEAMRERAAELGADAIILSWLEEPSGFERAMEGTLRGADADRRGRVVAIRWVDTGRRQTR